MSHEIDTTHLGTVEWQREKIHTLQAAGLKQAQLLDQAEERVRVLEGQITVQTNVLEGLMTGWAAQRFVFGHGLTIVHVGHPVGRPEIGSLRLVHADEPAPIGIVENVNKIEKPGPDDVVLEFHTEASVQLLLDLLEDVRDLMKGKTVEAHT